MGEYAEMGNKQIVHIAKMETSHLHNCARMLKRIDQTHTAAYKGICYEIRKRTKSFSNS